MLFPLLFALVACSTQADVPLFGGDNGGLFGGGGSSSAGLFGGGSPVHVPTTGPCVLNDDDYKCTKAGYYEIVQCDSDACFCVDPQSARIAYDTMTSNNKTTPRCSNCHTYLRSLFEHGQPPTGSYIPKCDVALGDYYPLQCDASHEFCFCVDQKTGKEIPGTKKRRSNNAIIRCDDSDLSVGDHFPEIEVGGGGDQPKEKYPVGRPFCKLDRDRGRTCNNATRQIRYYFDSKTFHCMAFEYLGCGGNENRFPTTRDCYSTCKLPDFSACSGLSAPARDEEGNAYMCGNAMIAAQSAKVQKKSRPTLNKDGCPSGYKCMMGAFFGYCCNKALEDKYSRAFRPTCPSGGSAYSSTEDGYNKARLGKTCGDNFCPTGYGCVTGDIYSKKGMKIVILGSGPTAMGAAYRLNQLIEDGVIDEKTQVLVLEKEAEVGGLARSVTDERGFTWDLGVHITGASKYKKFTNVINSAIPKWNKIPRCVKAYMGHVIQSDNVEKNYVPYPVQDSIAYFPSEVKQRCLNELEALIGTSPESSTNFAEFTAATFGETLQNEFIRPYNEKVWTVTLEEMNTAWVENRVPKTNLDELRQKCSMSAEELTEMERSIVPMLFRDLKGIGQLWKRVHSMLPPKWFKFNVPVVKIDAEKKKIFIDDSRYTSYDKVISTIPITDLGRMTGLVDVDLKFSKVVLVGIGLKRPQPEFTEDLSWLYFPQPETIFYRVTFLSNFNERMTPNAALFWSVVCEIGMKADEDINEEQVVEKTIEDLRKNGIMTAKTVVEDKWVHVLHHGYPIPTLNRDTELKKCHEILERHDIYSRGRFGSWKYEVANQDHSFTMGLEVVDKILFDTDESVFS